MKFRLQYSLLTLILLTSVCAVVMAYVVIPWRHEKRQTEIIERLKANEDLRFEFFEADKKGTYQLEHSSGDPTTLQFFVDTAVGSDRIHSIRLQGECYTEEQLAKFSRLHNLSKLELRSNAINEARMQILRKLPLKELIFDMPDDASFKTWPLQPQLEALRLRFAVDFPAPPLRLVAHPRLRELGLDSCPHDVEIESCLELQQLYLYPPYDDQPTRLKLRNLPKLESLTLLIENLQSESTIEEFAQLSKLNIRSELFSIFENHQLQNLTNFTADSFFTSLKPTQVEKILRLPQLENLNLQANWQDYSGGLRIPLMPQLHDLELREARARNGHILVPERLAIALLRQSPSLQSVKLPLQDLSAALLEAIATLEHLSYIHLDVRGKIHGDLSVLRRCSKLYKLELSFNELTAEHFAQVNELKQIENLHFHHRGEQEIEMAALRARPKLGVQYNHDYYTQNFPIMLPDRKAPLRIFRCNGGAMGSTAPTTTSPPASP